MRLLTFYDPKHHVDVKQYKCRAKNVPEVLNEKQNISTLTEKYEKKKNKLIYSNLLKENLER